jgi:fucose permease
VNARTRSIVVLIYGFVLLGMPSATLGVAWPSMADSLSRGLGDLGMITIAIGVSYGLVSVAIGWITKRFPAGRLLVVATLGATASLVVFAVADAWWWYLIAAIPLGVAGGSIDAVGNAYVAVRHGPRAMGAIHAAFGFGAMLAPLFMTVLFSLGLSWRIGFVVLAVAELALAGALWWVAGTIRLPMEGLKEAPKRLGRKRLLGMSIWVFFIYAGVEGSTGLWAFTLLTEGQGLSETVAGVAVAAHWAALFVSRLAIGVLGDRLPANRTLTLSVAGIAAGLWLIWWNPVAWVSVAGLIFAGFANGPVFPFEVLLTARRFGEQFTPWAVGYQLSAATFAIAIVPAVIGVLVNARGPLVIAPILAGLAVVMAASVEGLRVMSQRDATLVASSGSR